MLVAPHSFSFAVILKWTVVGGVPSHRLVCWGLRRHREQCLASVTGIEAPNFAQRHPELMQGSRWSPGMKPQAAGDRVDFLAAVVN